MANTIDFTTSATGWVKITTNGSIYSNDINAGTPVRIEFDPTATAQAGTIRFYFTGQAYGFGIEGYANVSFGGVAATSIAGLRASFAALFPKANSSSGGSGVVAITRSNLFDKTQVTGSFYVSSGGTQTANTAPLNIAETGLIPVTGLAYITVSGLVMSTIVNNNFYHFVDAGNTVVGWGLIIPPNPMTLVVPTGAVGFRFNTKFNNTDLSFYDTIQVEDGTAVNTYTPFGTTVTINYIQANNIAPSTKQNKSGSIVSGDSFQALSSPYNGKIGATFGDSMTLEISSLGVYSEVLKQKLGLSAMYKNGYSGAPIGFGDNSATLYNTGLYLAPLIATTPDFINFWAGINDFIHNAVLGDPNNIAGSATTTTVGAMNAIIRYIKAGLPKVRLFFCTPIPYPTQFTPNTKGHILADYVNALKAVCQANSVPVLDLYSMSGLSYQDSVSTWTFDNLHPNTYGYSIIVDLMTRFINNPTTGATPILNKPITTTDKVAAYTATVNDEVITGNATSSAFSITLPSAVDQPGKEFVIFKTDASANALGVATTSSQNIIGLTTATTFSLALQGKFVRVKSNAVAWLIIGSN